MELTQQQIQDMVKTYVDERRELSEFFGVPEEQIAAKKIFDIDLASVD